MPESPIPEEEEFARFESGALQIDRPDATDLERLQGYQKKLLTAAVHNEGLSTEAEITENTFVVERREYVNLYHTLIEIFNTFVAIQLFADDKPFNLLLLDGHCAGHLDSLWDEILQPSQIIRLHDYPQDSIRFSKLVLVPDGYHSPLYNLNRGARRKDGDLLSQFIDRALAAYNCQPDHSVEKQLVWVERHDYRPHPRSDGIADRKVADLDQALALLKQMYPDHRVTVHRFEEIPFREQLKIVRDADVVAGVHGAALTHALFMQPGSELVEFRPRSHRRNTIFEHLAALKDLRYQAFHARTTTSLPGGKQIVQPKRKRLGWF